MSEELPILYHEGRTGKMYSWKIWTEGADIVTEYGTVDGEKSITRKTATAKNVGKKNEVSPEDQAVREASAQHRKKLEKKYSLTLDEAKDEVFLPMLAHDYIKLFLKKGKVPEFPLDAQPKLNGVRCMAFWYEGEIHLMTRGGKSFTELQHIIDELHWLPKDMVLDGEIYLPGLSLQQINKLWKKFREGPEGTISLQYHVFDCFERNKLDMTWMERYDLLWNTMFPAKFNTERIKRVSTYKVTNENGLFELLYTFERDGYEGIILRKQQGGYNLGHRSRDLLKLKSFQDEEFVIIGHGEATGNDKGTVVWECETKDGQPFTVRPTGTREERRQLFETAEDYYGRKLTVKFQEYSDDGIPIFPVGIAIREPEDM